MYTKMFNLLFIFFLSSISIISSEKDLDFYALKIAQNLNLYRDKIKDIAQAINIAIDINKCKINKKCEEISDKMDGVLNYVRGFGYDNGYAVGLAIPDIIFDVRKINRNISKLLGYSLGKSISIITISENNYILGFVDALSERFTLNKVNLVRALYNFYNKRLKQVKILQ